MSSNLNIPQWVEAQAHPEVTTNNAIAALDAAITEQFTANVSAGNVSVTAAQYRAALKFTATSAATSGRTVTLPAVKRVTVFECASGNSDPVALVVGATSISFQPGEVALVYTDGTANGLAVTKLNVTTGSAHDLHVYISGVTTNAQIVLRFKATRAWSLPASLTGSNLTAGTASTGTATFTLKKNGASIGTIAFTTSATGVATFASLVSFAVGDIFSVEAPATADATLANIALDFLGSRV